MPALYLYAHRLSEYSAGAKFTRRRTRPERILDDETATMFAPRRHLAAKLRERRPNRNPVSQGLWISEPKTKNSKADAGVGLPGGLLHGVDRGQGHLRAD
jgi:hypothetical protein